MCPCVATNRHSANACLLLLIFAFNMCWVSRLSNDRSGLQSSAEDDEVPWQSKRQATCKKVWQLLLCECCGGACKSAHFFVRPKRSPCTGCSRCLSSMPSHHLLAWPKYFVLTPYVFDKASIEKPTFSFSFFFFFFWRRLRRYQRQILPRLTICLAQFAYYYDGIGLH